MTRRSFFSFWQSNSGGRSFRLSLDNVFSVFNAFGGGDFALFSADGRKNDFNKLAFRQKFDRGFGDYARRDFQTVSRRSFA